MSWCSVIDSGAEISLVSRDVVDALETAGSLGVVREHVCDIVGMNGKKVSVDAYVLLCLEFGEFKMSKPVKFAIVSKEVFPFCFLLGLDFMNYFNVSINFASNLVFFGKQAVPFSCDGKVETAQVFTTEVLRSSHSLNISNIGKDFRFEIKSNSSNSENISGLGLSIDDKVAELIQNCEELRVVRSHLKSKATFNVKKGRIKNFHKHLPNIVLLNNLIYYAANSCKVLVVSFAVLLDLVISLHSSFSHIGRDKMLNLIDSLVWHPLKYRVVNDVCSSCPQCQILKVNPNFVPPPMLKITTSSPFEMVAVDLISLPRTSSGFCCCLMMVDHFSKWVAAVPLRNKQSSTVIHALTSQILPYLLKVPQKILSDNGPEFSSREFKAAMESFSIQHILTTPNCPSSNSGIERVNKTILGFIRSITDKAESWDQFLSRVVITYNNTWHSSINSTPADCLLKNSYHDTGVPLVNVPRLQQHWSSGHDKFKPFSVGQSCLMKIKKTGNLTIDKLTPKYRGPLKILKVNPNKITYELAEPRSGAVVRAHHNDLFLYKDVPEYIRKHPWYCDLVNRSFGGRLAVGTGTRVLAGVMVDSNEQDGCSESESLSGSLSGETEVSVVAKSTSKASVSGEPAEASVTQHVPCLCCEFESKREQSPADLAINSSSLSELNLVLSDSSVNDSKFCISESISRISANHISDSNCSNDLEYDEFWSMSSNLSLTNENSVSVVNISEPLHTNRLSEGSDVLESEAVIEEAFHRLQSSLSRTDTPPVEARHTRSRGPVPEIPYVQPRILERKRAA